MVNMYGGHVDGADCKNDHDVGAISSSDQDSIQPRSPNGHSGNVIPAAEDFPGGPNETNLSSKGYHGDGPVLDDANDDDMPLGGEAMSMAISLDHAATSDVVGLSRPGEIVNAEANVALPHPPLAPQESFVSDMTQTSQSSVSSLEALLEKRRVDPEKVLTNLGFGSQDQGDDYSRVPMRFLQRSPGASGMNVGDILGGNEELSQLLGAWQQQQNGMSGMLHVNPWQIASRVSKAQSFVHKVQASVANHRLEELSAGRIPLSVLHPENQKALASQGFYDDWPTVTTEQDGGTVDHAKLKRKQNVHELAAHDKRKIFRGSRRKSWNMLEDPWSDTENNWSRDLSSSSGPRSSSGRSSMRQTMSLDSSDSHQSSASHRDADSNWIRTVRDWRNRGSRESAKSLDLRHNNDDLGQNIVIYNRSTMQNGQRFDFKPPSENPELHVNDEECENDEWFTPPDSLSGELPDSTVGFGVSAPKRTRTGNSNFLSPDVHGRKSTGSTSTLLESTFDSMGEDSVFEDKDHGTHLDDHGNEINKLVDPGNGVDLTNRSDTGKKFFLTKKKSVSFMDDEYLEGEDLQNQDLIHKMSVDPQSSPEQDDKNSTEIFEESHSENYAILNGNAIPNQNISPTHAASQTENLSQSTHSSAFVNNNDLSTDGMSQSQLHFQISCHMDQGSAQDGDDSSEISFSIKQSHDGFQLTCVDLNSSGSTFPSGSDFNQPKPQEGELSDRACVLNGELDSASISTVMNTAPSHNGLDSLGHVEKLNSLCGACLGITDKSGLSSSEENEQICREPNSLTQSKSNLSRNNGSMMTGLQTDQLDQSGSGIQNHSNLIGWEGEELLDQSGGKTSNLSSLIGQGSEECNISGHKDSVLSGIEHIGTLSCSCCRGPLTAESMVCGHCSGDVSINASIGTSPPQLQERRRLLLQSHQYQGHFDEMLSPDLKTELSMAEERDRLGAMSSNSVLTRTSSAQSDSSGYAEAETSDFLQVNMYMGSSGESDTTWASSVNTVLPHSGSDHLEPNAVPRIPSVGDLDQFSSIPSSDCPSPRTFSVKTVDKCIGTDIQGLDLILQVLTPSGRAWDSSQVGVTQAVLDSVDNPQEVYSRCDNDPELEYRLRLADKVDSFTDSSYYIIPTLCESQGPLGSGSWTVLGHESSLQDINGNETPQKSLVSRFYIDMTPRLEKKVSKLHSSSLYLQVDKGRVHLDNSSHDSSHGCSSSSGMSIVTSKLQNSDHQTADPTPGEADPFQREAVQSQEEAEADLIQREARPSQREAHPSQREAYVSQREAHPFQREAAQIHREALMHPRKADLIQREAGHYHGEHDYSLEPMFSFMGQECPIGMSTPKITNVVNRSFSPLSSREASVMNLSLAGTPRQQLFPSTPGSRNANKTPVTNQNPEQVEAAIFEYQKLASLVNQPSTPGRRHRLGSVATSCYKGPTHSDKWRSFSQQQRLIEESTLMQQAVDRYKTELRQLESSFNAHYSKVYDIMTEEERDDIEELQLLRAEVYKEVCETEKLITNRAMGLCGHMNSKTPLAALDVVHQMIELLKEQMYQRTVVLEMDNSVDQILDSSSSSLALSPWEDEPTSMSPSFMSEVKEDLTSLRREQRLQQHHMEKSFEDLKISLLDEVKKEFNSGTQSLYKELQAKDREILVLQSEVRTLRRKQYVELRDKNPRR